MKHWIARQHYPAPGKPNLALWSLLPLSWLYGWGVQLRLWAYHFHWLSAYTPGIPVISVGNLTTGGTGKTPIVVELARGLIRAGKRVAVLSRGYGASEPLAYGRALHPRHGDEAYMIQTQVPEAVVIVGRDRVQTLQKALAEYQPDYVLLDDGFQYLRLNRAMNLLLIDGARLLGNAQLLPAGPLREPLAQLRRADLIFVTQTVTQAGMNTIRHWVERHGTADTPVLPVPFHLTGLQAIIESKQPIPLDSPQLAALQHRPVIALSGIANPQGFEQCLREQGFQLLHCLRFADHHAYTAQDVQAIAARFHQHQAEQPLLITTEKDLPKVLPWLSQSIQEHTYTLQRQPNLDGRWFYDEFISQIPGLAETEAHAHPSTPSR